MPGEDKPYRVYRGGRARGRAAVERATPGAITPEALPPRGPAEPSEEHARAGGRDNQRPTPKRPRPVRHTPRRVRRTVVLVLALLITAVVLWGVLSFRSLSTGVDAANDRVPSGVRRLLTAQEGRLTSTATTILVLGTDGGAGSGREGARRSDSIMLVRADPEHGRIAYLSIPRDLFVDIPGYGRGKINAAFQYGGAALTLRTVKGLTGLDVNHIAFVDFGRFEQLIDAVGGIDVIVPRPIKSKPFDCPYTAKLCADWDGWRFERGRQHMDGRRALVYSRIRVNLLDPSESDLQRARRQQDVVRATADKLTSLGTLVRLPGNGSDLLAPLATDLSTWQVAQLGWVSMRADDKATLHCRLGGDPTFVDGESVITSSEDNARVIAMALGRAAPQRPPRGSTYAPGCVVGDRKL